MESHPPVARVYHAQVLYHDSLRVVKVDQCIHQGGKSLFPGVALHKAIVISAIEHGVSHAGNANVVLAVFHEGGFFRSRDGILENVVERAVGQPEVAIVQNDGAARV